MRTRQTRATPPGFVLTLGLISLACACLAASGIGAAGALTQESREGQKGSAVYGRVVYEGTDRPLRRARVVLFSFEERGREYMGVTDARGEFRIEGVEAGRFFAAVDAPGIVSPVSFIPIEQIRSDRFDASSVRELFEEIVVDGKTDKRVTVRAVRGAALGGRVTYADGEPVVGATVHVLMRRTDGLLAKFFLGFNPATMAGFRTDDRGAYRIPGLPAGEYVVAVSEDVEHVGGNNRPGRYLNDIRDGFFSHQLLMTYHPSAASVKDAVTIKVSEGEERDDVDITIAERQLRTLTGVVRGRRDNQPVSRSRVTITRRDEDALLDVTSPYGESANSVETDEHGRWQLQNIPDGSYAIQVMPPTEYGPDPPQFSAMNSNTSVSASNVSVEAVNMNSNVAYAPRSPRKKYAPARREIEVNAELGEIAVELSEGASVSGTVALQGGAVSLDCGTIFLLRLSEATGEPVNESSEGQSFTTGRFAFIGLQPGRYQLRTSTEYCPEGSRMYLSSATHGGRDLTREPLVVPEGDRLRAFAWSSRRIRRGRACVS